MKSGPRECVATSAARIAARASGSRSLFGHPGLAQALEIPIPSFNKARRAVRLAALIHSRLPRRDRLGTAGNRRKVTLEVFTGHRLMTGQSKRRDEVEMSPRIIRIDRDRRAGIFNRLIVLLEPEIGRRSRVIPKTQIDIVWTLPIALSEIRRFFQIARGTSNPTPKTHRRWSGWGPRPARVRTPR